MMMFDVVVVVVVVVWSRSYGTQRRTFYCVGDLDSKNYNCTEKLSCLLYDIYMYLTEMSEGISKTVVTDIGGLEWDHVI